MGVGWGGVEWGRDHGDISESADIGHRRLGSGGRVWSPGVVSLFGPILYYCFIYMHACASVIIKV